MNRRKLFITSFLFLLAFGSIFDTIDKVNRYGWTYTISTFIDGEEINKVEYRASQSIIFSMLIFVNFIMSLSLLFETKET